MDGEPTSSEPLRLATMHDELLFTPVPVITLMPCSAATTAYRPLPLKTKPRLCIVPMRVLPVASTVVSASFPDYFATPAFATTGGFNVASNVSDAMSAV